jgi:hypothetical protein
MYPAGCSGELSSGSFTRETQGEVVMDKDVKNPVISFAVLIGLLAVSNHQTLAAAKPPTPGGALPPLQLLAPEDSAAKIYLGRSENEHFTVSQIRAKVVIIELFSMT